MVPVGVANKDGGNDAIGMLFLQGRAKRSDARSGIQNDNLLVGCKDIDARGVGTIADGVRSWRRYRSTDTPKADSHVLTLC